MLSQQNTLLPTAPLSALSPPPPDTARQMAGHLAGCPAHATFLVLSRAGFTGAEIARHHTAAERLANPPPTFQPLPSPGAAANLGAAVTRASALLRIGSILASCEYPAKTGSAPAPVSGEA